MLEFRPNPHNSQLDVIVFTSMEVNVGYLTEFNVPSFWTFSIKDNVFLYGDELIQIANKLKELNEAV